jgi:hypothetical protein
MARLPLLSALLLLAATAWGQPSTVMRPALLAELELDASFSSREELARGDVPMGEVAVSRFGFSVSGRHQRGADTTYIFGLAAATFELDGDGLALPDQLRELSVNLGVQRRLGSAWAGGLYARPGLYGDFEEMGEAFNVPVLATLRYHRSADLTWIFGLNANPLSDNPVLPIVGAHWRFAPDWSFQLGFPQTGLTRRVGDRLSFRAGLSFAGGSFRITRNLGVPAPGIPRLANTRLDFREVRAGLGADWKVGSDATVSLDLGAVTDRKFDYIDRDYRLDGDGGYFVSLALRRGR